MFLKNKNIIFKIRRSKVTDYAALSRLETSHSYHLDESFSVLKFVGWYFSCVFFSNVNRTFCK